jgi:tRNA A-37 threonylcarbamoyl transferase component Bud32
MPLEALKSITTSLSVPFNAAFKKGCSLETFLSAQREILNKVKSALARQENADPKEVAKLKADIQVLKYTTEMAKSAKSTYYFSTLIGRISRLFQKLFKITFSNHKTPIDQADEFIRSCDDLLASCDSETDEEKGEEQRREMHHHFAGSLSRLAQHLFKEQKKTFMVTLEQDEGKNPTTFLLLTPGDHSKSSRWYLVSKNEGPSGSGACKATYQGIDDQGNAVAVSTNLKKRVDPKTLYQDEVKVCKETKSKMKTELEILKRLDNATGIIKPEAFIEAKVNELPTTFYITPFFKNGDLSSFLKKNPQLSTEQKRHFTTSLIKALSNLHKKGIIHRDIKEGNILVGSDNHLVLIDFDGSCDKRDNEAKKKQSGTPNYLAPEYAQAMSRNQKANLLTNSVDGEALIPVTTDKIDVWSLGLVLYRIWHGKELVEQEPLQHIRTEKYTQQMIDQIFGKNVSNIDSMIKWMLTVDPNNRPDMNSIMIKWINIILELSKIKSAHGRAI